MANKLQIKRTSVTGRVPNTTNSGNTHFIDTGELALNLTDGKLFSSNGSVSFEVGANLSTITVAGNGSFNNVNVTNTTNTAALKVGTKLTVNSSTVSVNGSIKLSNNNTGLVFTDVGGSTASALRLQDDNNFVFYLSNTSGGERAIYAIYANSTSSNLQIFAPLQPQGGIVANGSLGSSATVLKSDGAGGIYWDTVTGGGGGTVTQVNTGIGLSGGPITTTGTISVLANTGIVANATGLYVNSAYIATLAANSATYLGGNTAADLQTYANNKAANAYSNAVSYADTKAATAYSNATSYADTKAATAYANAISFAAAVADAAYTNATSFSANADNISSGTLNAARLPSTAVQTTDSKTLSGNLIISGTSFNPASNTVLLGNTTSRWVLSANTGDFSGSVTINNTSIISANSSTAALRITQMGTGNALVVEDSDNPDSTPVVVDTNGRLIVGATAFDGNWYTGSNVPIIWAVANTSNRGGLGSVHYGAPAGLSLLRAGGTTIGTESAVSAGDNLGIITFGGYDGVTPGAIPAGWIATQVDGTVGTANDMPGRMIFGTTAVGGNSPTERMRIDSSGQVGIGGSAAAGVSLQINNADISQTRQLATTNGVDTRLMSIGLTSNAGQVGTWSNHPFTIRSNDVERIRFAANGNIGIGNTTPGSKLVVEGAKSIFTSDDTSTSVDIVNRSSTASRFPQLRVLHYSGNSTGGAFGGQPVVELFHRRGTEASPASTASGDNLGGFNTWGGNTTSILSATRIEGVAEANFTTTATAAIRFLTTDNGTQSERVRMSANGNVGIGTSTPSFKLQVSGTVSAGNTEITGFANASSLTVGTSFIANATQLTVATPLAANGTVGTAGQVLTSNGATGSPYWAPVSMIYPGTGIAVSNGTGWNTSISNSAGLAAAISDETGTGSLVFGTGPTLVDPVITGTIREDIFALTDGATIDIDPGNGSIQTLTLAGTARTLTYTNMLDGESVTLMINDGTAGTITTWNATFVNNSGNAPFLSTTGYTTVVVWKVGGVVYAAVVGNA